jgi:urea transport system ATP-binding protein
MMTHARENRLVLRKLSVDFSGFIAVDQVDLTVEPGKIQVVIGPNGAGKTTLLDLITGKTQPVMGTAEFRGHQLVGKSTPYICKKYHVGRKFQGPNVFNELTARQNMRLAAMGGNSFWSYFFKRDQQEYDEKIDECLKKVNLFEYKDIKASSLSHGQKQWLEIGMVIIQDAQLVVLDEPTAGMTAEETFKTGEMIKRNFRNKTVVAIEHDMDFVRQIAEKVTVLHQGRIFAEGTFEEIEQNPKVIQIYLRQSTEGQEKGNA